MPDPQPALPPTETGRSTQQATRRRALRDLLRPGKGQFVVGLALCLTGFIVVVTLQSQAAQPEFSGVRQADLIQLLDNVTSETRRLEDQVRSLESSRSELETGANRDEAAKAEADRRLEQAQILAGTVPAKGPGIRMVISDPAHSVTAELLLDALEELRDAGAEVISLDGSVRVVMDTALSTAADGSITADGVTLSAPYTIEAIGDPATLEAGARFRGGLVSEVEGDRVGGSVTITQLDELTIATIAQPHEYVYARPR